MHAMNSFISQPNNELNLIQLSILLTLSWINKCKSPYWNENNVTKGINVSFYMREMYVQCHTNSAFVWRNILFKEVYQENKINWYVKLKKIK